LNENDLSRIGGSEVQRHPQWEKWALDQVEALAQLEDQLLDIALDAPSMDCAVAFERVQRAFLLCGADALIDKAETIRGRCRPPEPLNRLMTSIGCMTKWRCSSSKGVALREHWPTARSPSNKIAE
jgi:hypothetical protein